MLQFIIRRILITIPMLLAVSILVFVIIQLPPGDVASHQVNQLLVQGIVVQEGHLEALRARYGLDRPMYQRYFLWMGRLMRGDLGVSFIARRPVMEVVAERLPLTAAVALASLVFTWVVAFLVGVYSATHQYSLGDYAASFIGFLGLATPNFMLALIMLWIAYSVFGQTLGGLQSAEFRGAGWSIPAVLDFLRHLIIPTIVVGTAGTAGTIRILRANLLDELKKPYVVTAEAKGVPAFRRLFKYPVRVALLPFMSTVGWQLPILVSGEVITAVVLGLPTVGPMLLSALLGQDMYLAGALVLFISLLTIVGTLISDILLAWIDPRIRYV